MTRFRKLSVTTNEGGKDAHPVWFNNYYSRETFTNVANGKSVTAISQGLFKDVHIEHVEGTVYRFTAIETGRPIVVFGPDGKRLFFDRGRIRYTVLIDTLGDDNPDNDQFISDESEPDVAGPHPVFVGTFTFCDAIATLR